MNILHPSLRSEAKDGSQILRFNGGEGAVGSWISQEFDTLPGATYKVSFFVARYSPGAYPGTVSITASVRSSQNGTLLGSVVALPPTAAFGLTQELSFTAISATSTIQFVDSSTATTGVDVTLDNVVVVATSPLTLPAITKQPVSQTVNAGLGVMFTTQDTNGATYQWFKNGTALAGATNANLSLPRAQLTDAGRYSLLVTNWLGSVSTSTVTLTVLPPKLSNLSVRSAAGIGDQTLIVGFVLSGDQLKQTLVRGVGPALAQFGVNGSLVNPLLKLFSGAGSQIGLNDDWGGGSALADSFARVGAFSLAPTSRDAALLVPLVAGAYSAQVGSDATTGVALVEVYDADDSSARFVNLSARNQVGTGDNILIVGFTISGNTAKTLLVRGIGPTLAQFGVGGVLVNPRLQMYKGNDLVAENDDWGGGSTFVASFTQVGAFALPSTSRDAALLLLLQPGAYTAQVSGVANATGVALVEVYEMP